MMGADHGAIDHLQCMRDRGTIELVGMGSIENSSRVIVDGALDLENKGNEIAFWGVSDAYNDAKIRNLAGSGSVFIYDSDLVLTAAQDTFSGTISSVDSEGRHLKGGLTVQGGVQTLSGANVYFGATKVDAGAGLVLTSTGSLASDVLVSGGFVNDGDVAGDTIVQDGGMTGGSGSYSALTVLGGGTVATNGKTPLTVGSEFTQKAGSTLVFAPVENGIQPAIAVGGRAVIEDGASITLDRVTTGRLAVGREYALVTAAGGLVGNYGSLTGDLVTDAPFLSFALDKTSSGVALGVERSDIVFAEVAHSANQIAVANELEALGSGNELHDEVAYMTAAEASDLLRPLIRSRVKSIPRCWGQWPRKDTSCAMR